MSSVRSHNPPWLSDYTALTHRAALVDLGHRTQIEVSGADRATFLHNLCTNEVRKLVPGSGREAFVTTVQGKILAHLFAFVGPNSIVISTVPGQAEKILKHLERYLVCEQVVLADRSQQWVELLAGGPESSTLVATISGLSLPDERLAHGAATIAGRRVWLRRVDMAGPQGFLIAVTASDADAVAQAIIGAGATRAAAEAFEAARIERGFPLYGTDISDDNLPQEVARDSQAVSFTKGCYLGQETVARIDALGHVNKTLVGLAFSPGSQIAPGSELLANGQPAGRVTSAAWSPRLGAPLALGYVRRGHNAQGTRLRTIAGSAEATVVSLPVME